MKKLGLFVCLATVLTIMVGCSALDKLKNQNNGGSKPAFDLAGSWEVVATSTQNQGVISIVEFNVPQGTNGNINVPAQEGVWNTSATVLGNCYGVIPGNPQGQIVATVGADNVQGTFTETGPAGESATFSITAPLSSATTFSGNYGTVQNSGSVIPGACLDSGTYVATKTSSLSGNYAGPLTYPDGSHETVTVTMTQDAAYNVTVTGTATGGMQDGPINMTGTVTGNLAVLHGTDKSGNPLTLFAWWDANYPRSGGASPVMLQIIDNTGYEYGALPRQ
jgi:hypothetical protein